jgi:hypothetical protein
MRPQMNNSNKPSMAITIIYFKSTAAGVYCAKQQDGHSRVAKAYNIGSGRGSSKAIKKR